MNWKLVNSDSGDRVCDIVADSFVDAGFKALEHLGFGLVGDVAQVTNFCRGCKRLQDDLDATTAELDVQRSHVQRLLAANARLEREINVLRTDNGVPGYADDGTDLRDHGDL